MEEQLFDYLLPYYEQGLDAVIVQDFGVLTFIREAFPQLSIHASTQMTVTGTDGAAFLQKQGASRIVTARELSFEEIQKNKIRYRCRNRELCTWSALLLLFRRMSLKQYARRTQRQPWKMCAAPPASI